MWLYVYKNLAQSLDYIESFRNHMISSWKTREFLSDKQWNTFRNASWSQWFWLCDCCIFRDVYALEHTKIAENNQLVRNN